MLVDLDFSILPGMDIKETDSGLTKLLGEYSFEHKALLIYEKSETFRLLTGYKFVFGESRILPFLFLVILNDRITMGTISKIGKNFFILPFFFLLDQLSRSNQNELLRITKFFWDYP